MIAPQSKRCPNCAWAMGMADMLQLPQEESWILTVIAENVGPDMQLHATMAELSRMTRIKPVTLSKHVRSLAANEKCIDIRRSRDGYHYTLKRSKDAHSKPRQSRVRMPYDDDQELQKLQLSGPQHEPEVSRIVGQDTQNMQFPIMIPLKEPLKEGSTSLRSAPDVRAEVFTEGLQILRSLTGKPEGGTRRLLGQMCKTAGDDCARVMAALRNALDHRPAEPVSFIMGSLRPRSMFENIHAKLGTTSLWATINDDIDVIEGDAP